MARIHRRLQHGSLRTQTTKAMIEQIKPTDAYDDASLRRKLNELIDASNAYEALFELMNRCDQLRHMLQAELRPKELDRVQSELVEAAKRARMPF